MKFLENITPREYQEKIFQTCKDMNCLVVLPTGLGKTLIALMLTIERIQEFPGEKVLFLAPTRPLAEQHMISFKKNLPDLFADIQIFTGGVPPKERKKIWQTADIIFSTPQCISNDLKHNLYNLEEVCLLVEDEAHRCVSNYSYNLVAQSYKKQGLHQRVLGLTASPGSDPKKIKSICRNLSIETVELRTRESPDVKPYLQELEFRQVKVNLPSEFIEIKAVLSQLFDSYISELRNRRLLWGAPSKTELLKLQKKLGRIMSTGGQNFNVLLGISACAQAIKLQHALELLETQTLVSFNRYLKELFKKAPKSKGTSRLISKPQFNFAYIKSEELLRKNIEHPKVKKLLEIVGSEKESNPDVKILIFSQYRETASLLSKRMNSIRGIKSKIFVGQAKKRISEGISGLSQKEQKKIIGEFSDRKVNVLCATSIGEEGLDIPEVNVVIFYEPVPSAIRAIQRAGRTARLMEGKLIMLITRQTRDEAYYYVSRAREKRMHSAIDEIKEDLSTGKFNTKDIQKKLQ